MSYKYLNFEEKERVGIVTINKPEALNALDSTVIDELDSLLDELQDRLKESEAWRLLALTGAGKAFIAGADVKQMQNMTPEEARAFSRKGNRVARRIETFSIPVVAAVNGFALGGGLEFVLCCDFAYASKKARMGLPEATLGIMPGFGGNKRLCDRIGKARAKELAYTGRMINAEAALEWGLVNKVCEPESLMDDIMALAEELEKASPHSVREIKEQMNLCAESDTERALMYETEKFGLLFSHPDAREGKDAFVEKKKPNWRK